MNQIGMIEATDGGDAGLHWHITANFFPPISAVWVPVARKVIEQVAGGDVVTPVEPPDGYNGNEPIDPLEVAEALRLWPFIDWEKARE